MSNEKELERKRIEVDKLLSEINRLEEKERLRLTVDSPEIHSLISRINELAEQRLMEASEVAEIIGKILIQKKKARKLGVFPPKYANPANKSQTWSGRGKKPAWIKEAEDNGIGLDNFLIRS